MNQDTGSDISPLRIPTDNGSDEGSTRKNGIAMPYASNDIATVWKNRLSKAFFGRVLSRKSSPVTSE